jgi:energy-coupling factor transport system ATP-binding protein
MRVTVESLSYRYPSGVVALDGVALAVEPGERLAIIGQNGAGKTTLVRHLNGMVRPTAGTVRVGDWITAEKSIAQLAARVGYVFQNPDEQLFARTVQLDVSFGPRNLGLDAAAVDEAVARALAATGLTAEAQTHPHHLSLSERKRVAIAAVLAMQTPVVVLDEPTTGQDENGVQLVARIVSDLATSGTTVVAITHDMDFCAENFERVVVMAEGRIIDDGPPARIFSSPEKLRTAAVEPPQLARVAREAGWGETPLSVDGFVDRLAAERSAR